MNKDWTDFLISEHATITSNSNVIFSETESPKQNFITALAHLSIIKITGKDAAIFLQGQLTCNIKELTNNNSFFCAFCNAKGRTISTLLILKSLDDYLLIMPAELVNNVCTKLQMYILRSDVQIQNMSDELCLTALSLKAPEQIPSLPEEDFSVTHTNTLIIKFPSKNNRYLIVGSKSHAITLWKQLTELSSISPRSSDAWRYDDISAGIAWLTLATTEAFIPQMLNIDKLGGISFNKGCYTGQEIIARTHYLGKAKRELFLAECSNLAKTDDETKLFLEGEQQSTGKLLSLQSNAFNTRLLIVIPTADAELKKLVLNNLAHDVVQIIEFR